MYLDELISNLFSDPKNINFSLRKVHLIRKLKGDQNYLITYHIHVVHNVNENEIIYFLLHIR